MTTEEIKALKGRGWHLNKGGGTFIEKVQDFYRSNGLPGERFCKTLDRLGLEIEKFGGMCKC